MQEDRGYGRAQVKHYKKKNVFCTELKNLFLLKGVLLTGGGGGEGYVFEISKMGNFFFFSFFKVTVFKNIKKCKM